MRLLNCMDVIIYCPYITKKNEPLFLRAVIKILNDAHVSLLIQLETHGYCSINLKL